MTTGTNGQVQPRAVKARRDTTIWALAGVLFVLSGTVSLMSADAWYLVTGACIMLVAAAVFVARAIISLRTDEYATSE